MYRIISWLLFLQAVSATNQVYAQPASESVEVSKLQNQIQALGQMLVSRDSVEYHEKWLQVFDGFYFAVQLPERSASLQQSLGRHAMLADMLNVNNPDTRQLIDQVQQQLFEAVDKQFEQTVGVDSVRRKTLLGRIRDLFVNNPITVPILHSNPVTSAISGAFTWLSGLFEPRISTRKSGSGNKERISDVRLDLMPLLNSQFLAGIRAKVEPYYRFFDTLQVVNQQFVLNLTMLKDKAKSLQELVQQQAGLLKAKHQLTSSMNPSQISVRLYAAYPKELNGAATDRYQSWLMQPAFREDAKLAAHLAEYQQVYNALVREINQAFSRFQQQYLDVLTRYQGKLPLMQEKIDMHIRKLREQPNTEVIANQQVRYDGMDDALVRRLIELERRTEVPDRLLQQRILEIR
jgi:hypothetical protein